MPEGEEYVELDAMQTVSCVRDGTTANTPQKGEDGYDSYSYPNAAPLETQTIYVGQQQYADPNAAMNSECGFPSEPPQDSEKKCALLRLDIVQ